jgi:hypothetical protein
MEAVIISGMLGFAVGNAFMRIFDKDLNRLDTTSRFLFYLGVFVWWWLQDSV